MDETIMEAIMTSKVLYSDSGESVSELTSEFGSDEAGSEYYASSLEISPYPSPAHEQLERRRTRSTVAAQTGAAGRFVMNDRDKSIYNSLGSSSSAAGKLTFSELGLGRGAQKRGIMWKTGPKPSWYSVWKRRAFVLKGNFLYYFSLDQTLEEASVHGAIYLRNAIIEKVSMPMAKNVLKISPPVPRRKGWEGEDEETSVFHVKFKTERGKDEWFEDLQQVAFDHTFPAEQEPLINTSMEYKFASPRH